VSVGSRLQDTDHLRVTFERRVSSESVVTPVYRVEGF